MKVKVCVSCEDRKSNHNPFGGYLGYAVSNMDDRKSTIRLLRKLERGEFWNDLAYDYIYQFKIAPANTLAELVRKNNCLKQFNSKNIKEIKINLKKYIQFEIIRNMEKNKMDTPFYFENTMIVSSEQF